MLGAAYGIHAFVALVAADIVADDDLINICAVGVLGDLNAVALWAGTVGGDIFCMDHLAVFQQFPMGGVCAAPNIEGGRISRGRAVSENRKGRLGRRVLRRWVRIGIGVRIWIRIRVGVWIGHNTIENKITGQVRGTRAGHKPEGDRGA